MLLSASAQPRVWLDTIPSQRHDPAGMPPAVVALVATARELFLSPHSVRHYVRSVFEKLGVSSRGELVAKLFAEHYAEPLHANCVHVT
jgi:hypothetical protein